MNNAAELIERGGGFPNNTKRKPVQTNTKEQLSVMCVYIVCKERMWTAGHGQLTKSHHMGPDEKPRNFVIDGRGRFDPSSDRNFDWYCKGKGNIKQGNTTNAWTRKT